MALPHIALTRIWPDRESYTIDVSGAQAGPAGGQRTYGRRGASTSRPFRVESESEEEEERQPEPQQQQHYYDQLLYDQVHQLQNQFQQFQVQQQGFMDQFDIFQQDHRLAMYPIYDHFARQGVVRPTGPHPSWYTYPQGGFGPNGEGTSGMAAGGGRGGNGDDDDDVNREEFIDTFQSSP